jgi:uncharacterized protein
MKYIVVALVVLVGIWSWRRGREQERAERQQQRAAPSPAPAPGTNPTTDMVACAHCGLHLPANEAVPGQRGVYCGHAHRQAHES